MSRGKTICNQSPQWMEGWQYCINQKLYCLSRISVICCHRQFFHLQLHCNLHTSSRHLVISKICTTIFSWMHLKVQNPSYVTKLILRYHWLLVYCSFHYLGTASALSLWSIQLCMTWLIDFSCLHNSLHTSQFMHLLKPWQDIHIACTL